MQAVSLSNPQSLNLYSYCENDPINSLDPDGLFIGKLFGWVGKAFKFLFKVAAIVLVVVAMVLLPTIIAAGGFWLASGAWFGWGSWAALMGVAGAAGLAGWHNGKLGEIAGAFLGTLGKGGNFRTPPINGGSGAGSVSDFLQRRGRGSRSSGFATAERAAIAALRAINRRSIRENREYAGRICRTGTGGFIHTAPIPGTANTSNSGSCPSGTQNVGDYHTHAAYDPRLDTRRAGGVDGNEVFSRADMNGSDSEGVPGWLATPSGRLLRYTPHNTIYHGPGIAGGTVVDLTRRYRRVR